MAEKVQNKKIVIQVNDKFLKVPMNYLTLDVPEDEADEDMSRESIQIRGTISSLSCSGGIGTIYATIPNIYMEMKVSRPLADLDLKYSDELVRVYSKVCAIYKRKYKKLKIKSRVGVQMKIKYDLDTLKIDGDDVRLRSVIDDRELLIPNVYKGTGKICWGRGNTVPDFEKPEYMAGGLMTAFLTAPFNNDLTAKELRAYQYVRYLQACNRRVSGLDWSQGDKNLLKTWVDGEIRYVYGKVGDITLKSEVTRNSYILILLASIFEDDICELSGFIHSKQLKF
ncbi:hypothetical protein [Bacillus mycoides]|uniref:hypothetical protein n=1 Tax=Bacillus mycoides TaxID=1405 RepID=UPI003A80CE0C